MPVTGKPKKKATAKKTTSRSTTKTAKSTAKAKTYARVNKTLASLDKTYGTGKKKSKVTPAMKAKRKARANAMVNANKRR